MVSAAWAVAAGMALAGAAGSGEILERGRDFLKVRTRGTNSFTILERGLHYQEGGRWVPSQERVERASGGGLAARRGPHRAWFSPTLQAGAVFDLSGPRGTRLRGGVQAIRVADAVSGRIVTLGLARAEAEAELHEPNRVVYRDAFTGSVSADVLLIWRHNYIAHEVVLRSPAPLPEGFSAEAARLEIVTEFSEAPCAEISERRLASGTDHSFIRLGGFSIPPGRAAPVDESSGSALGGPNPRGDGTEIGKRWEALPDGRARLIESIAWADLKAHEADAPRLAAADSPSRPYAARGVAADFVLLPDWGEPTIFQAGQTYVVRSTYYVGGPARFEPGCVIKNHGPSSLVLHGSSISFPAAGAPCVFTSIDDDLHGERVAGSRLVPESDGNPEDSLLGRVDDALRIWEVNYPTHVQNAVFRWANCGIEYFRTGPQASHTIGNSRFEHITFAGLLPAVQVSIDPARSVIFQHSRKCNVDLDYSRHQGNVSGSLLTDCAVVDATALNGHEIEPAIVVRQIGPSQTRIAIVAMYRESPDYGNVLMRSLSDDGGATWRRTVIADGAFKEADGATPMLVGLADPTMVYDQFGNLFLAYNGLLNGEPVVPLYVSTDHGESFTRVSSFTIRDPDRDLPRLAAGPSGIGGFSSVWVSYRGRLGGRVRGTLVRGLGAQNVDPSYNDRTFYFGYYSKLTGPAVGPNGELAIAHIDLMTDQPFPGFSPLPPKNLRIAFDPDGLGPAEFPYDTSSFPINLGWEGVKATDYFSEIIPIPMLAWDRPRNRLYLVYHDRPSLCASPPPYGRDEEPCTSDTDIYLRVGTLSGGALVWSDRIRINDDPLASRKSQFFPRVAVDPATGNVAVSWFDARLAPNNDRVHFFAAVSRDGFATRPRNFQLNPAASNGLVYGWFWDYTGLAYDGGVLYPAWPDNSNYPFGNPNGTFDKYDTHVARVRY